MERRALLAGVAALLAPPLAAAAGSSWKADQQAAAETRIITRWIGNGWPSEAPCRIMALLTISA